jgi:hypothetical protein
MVLITELKVLSNLPKTFLVVEAEKKFQRNKNKDSTELEEGRHDYQHNDIQFNDSRDNDTKHNIQHNDTRNNDTQYNAVGIE